MYLIENPGYFGMEPSVVETIYGNKPVEASKKKWEPIIQEMFRDKMRLQSFHLIPKAIHQFCRFSDDHFNTIIDVFREKKIQFPWDALNKFGNAYYNHAPEGVVRICLERNYASLEELANLCDDLEDEPGNFLVKKNLRRDDKTFEDDLVDLMAKPDDSEIAYDDPTGQGRTAEELLGAFVSVPRNYHALSRKPILNESADIRFNKFKELFVKWIENGCVDKLPRQ